MRESTSEEPYFREQVMLAGGYTIKIIPTEAGVTDRLVSFKGRIYLVELKTAKGELSKIQLFWHKRLTEEFGIRIDTLYGKSEIDNWVATTLV